MEAETLEKLKYPIGKFIWKHYDENERKDFIETIASFSNNIKSLVENLNDEQLEKTYRPGGWTLRQVVHHCADSHMNAFIRFKLALTENKPTIKAYEEQLWAEQADYKLPVQVSLSLIEGLHARWVSLLKSMKTADFEAKYIHPQSGKELDLNYMLALYNWHCRHHLGHIESTL